MRRQLFIALQIPGGHHIRLERARGDIGIQMAVRRGRAGEQQPRLGRVGQERREGVEDLRNPLGGHQPATGFQKAFFRAGHAHAGVLVILSLVAQIYADATGMTELAGWLGRSAIPLAAILMPAGFFFSAMGRDATKPNRFILLIYAGAASLAVGVVSLGLGLLMAV